MLRNEGVAWRAARHIWVRAAILYNPVSADGPSRPSGTSTSRLALGQGLGLQGKQFCDPFHGQQAWRQVLRGQLRCPLEQVCAAGLPSDRHWAPTQSTRRTSTPGGYDEVRSLSPRADAMSQARYWADKTGDSSVREPRRLQIWNYCVPAALHRLRTNSGSHASACSTQRERQRRPGESHEHRGQGTAARRGAAMPALLVTPLGRQQLPFQTGALKATPFVHQFTGREWAMPHVAAHAAGQVRPT